MATAISGNLTETGLDLKLGVDGEYGRLKLGDYVKSPGELDLIVITIWQGKIIDVTGKMPGAKRVDEHYYYFTPTKGVDCQRLASGLKAYFVDKNSIEDYQELLTLIGLLNQLLTSLGYTYQPVTDVKKISKPRHRWNKEISQQVFKLDYNGARATVYWRKRQELILMAGAELVPQPRRNKSGEIGFEGRFGLHLRQEHQNSITANRTIEDLVFKSVNEIGLFMYFGGTNGWLELKDEKGRTINDWSVV